MRDDANGLLARWRLALAAACDGRLTRADLAVLLVILDHINVQTGEAWPSAETVATTVGASVRSVIRARHRLVGKGLLTETIASGRPNRYRMGTPDNCATPDTRVTPDKDVTPPLTPVSPTPDTGVTPPLTPVSDEHAYRTSLENQLREPTESSRAKRAHKRDRKERAAASSRSKRSVELEVIKGMALPASLTRESWHNFVEHREAMPKQKRLTRKAAELSLRKLEGFAAEGHDPNEIVDEAIANGWQSLYAPKASGRAPGSLADRVRRSAEDFANYDFSGKASPPRRPAAHTAHGPSEAEAERMNAEAERRLAKLKGNTHG